MNCARCNRDTPERELAESPEDTQYEGPLCLDCHAAVLKTWLRDAGIEDLLKLADSF